MGNLFRPVWPKILTKGSWSRLGEDKSSLTLAVLFSIVLVILISIARNVSGKQQKNRPYYISSWIPYFGHGLWYLRDQRGFFQWCNAKAKGKPFSVFITEPYHIFSHPSDVSAIFRKSSTLTESREGQTIFRQNILRFSRDDAERVASLRSEEAKLHNTYLLMSIELDKNISRFVEEVDFQLQPAGFSGEWENGFDCIGELMMRSTVATLFGRKIFQEYGPPVLFRDLTAFLTQWFILRRDVGLPDWLAPKAAAARERIKDKLRTVVDEIDGLTDDGCKKKHDQPSEYVQQRIKTMRSLGVSAEGVVANEFDIILGSNLNSIPMAYLTLLHILDSPTLKSQILAELSQAHWTTLSPSARASLLPYGLPCLLAVLHEVMRFHTTAWSTREVTQATILDLKPIDDDPSPRIYELEKGSIVAMPSSLLHHNEAIHANSGMFDPLRFLAAEHGGRDTAVYAGTLRPFGGGGSYCPGRKFAERQVVGFVADLLAKFDVEVQNDRGKLPIPDNADFFFVVNCTPVAISLRRKE